MSRLIRRIFDRANRKPTKRLRATRPIHTIADLKTRLLLQPLEDRMAPAVFTANALTDTGTGAAGTGDLRYCITQANASTGPTTINITATGAIILGSTLPTIASGHDLTINGPGAGQLTISGNNLFRIFVDSTSNFSISGVTLAKGLVAGTGAGIQLSAANENLTITNSVVTGCSGTSGGGIYTVSGDAVSITGSTLSNNTAASSGGAIDMNGNATGGGSLTINTSQIINNIAPGLAGLAGGIKMAHGGPLSITNSTLAGNSAGSIGGAFTSSETPLAKPTRFPIARLPTTPPSRAAPSSSTTYRGDDPRRHAQSH